MDIYEMIQKLEGEELDQFITERIEDLEEESREINPQTDTIGYQVDCNPEDYHLLEEKIGDSLFHNEVDFYPGYIRKGTRIVHSIYFNGDKRVVCNKGMYYYLDDDSYIREFCHSIKGRKISNEYNLFVLIHHFMRDYFGVLPDISREEMFTLLYERENVSFPPQKEHSITDFKKRGNAVCTEYAALAQNIMSFFGFKSYYVFGRMQIGHKKDEEHAFHFIAYKEKKTNQAVAVLIDYACPIKVYNNRHQLRDYYPYMIDLEEFDQKFINDFFGRETHLIVQDYGYGYIGNIPCFFWNNANRDYYVTRQKTVVLTVNKCKEMMK